MLAGPVFLRRWQPPERSAADLYHVMRVSMPKLAMGSLTPEDYAAVFAYVLQRNGWPSGHRRFDASDSQLQSIRLDRLAAAAGPARLTAVDAARGTVRWRYRSAQPMVAGVAATAGGLVFTGEETGDFIALDAATGRELYRFYTGGGIRAAS